MVVCDVAVGVIVVVVAVAVVVSVGPYANSMYGRKGVADLGECSCRFISSESKKSQTENKQCSNQKHPGTMLISRAPILSRTSPVCFEFERKVMRGRSLR